MTTATQPKNIKHYAFHHIDVDKCHQCTKFSCEEACFRGIYKVINKDSSPESTVVEDREDMCVKCHMCTSVCKYEAITID